ncbi:MAG: hypothetical protein J1F22_08105 [Lachnospiraceae bacterium]|nr:hypothetical protein [Lachnospiraceae bacterium]
MADLVSIGRGRKSDDSDRKKTNKMIGIVALFIVLGVGALVLLSYYFNNRCFYGYEVESAVKRSDSNNVNYMYYKKEMLKYSRSGISGLDTKGKSLWNGGYEMKQPQLDICGDYIVTADVMGKQFYVYNGKDEGTSMETTLPIVRAKVAGQGVVAALLQDSDSNVLSIYNPYGSTENLLVEIPTNVSEEGYPLDFDISPDGKSVVTSHMTISGNTVENKVSFYNFTEVGQDKNTLVGGKSFGESMISAVEFVGDDEVAVFYETGFRLFTRMKQPELLAEKDFGKEEEIRSMAYSDKYIGVVTETAGDNKKQKLYLYNLKGKEELKRDISYDYAEMKIYGEEIVFYSNYNCYIMRTNGREKFNCEFEEEIDAIFPTENENLYTLIDASEIKTIKLSVS